MILNIWENFGVVYTSEYSPDA